MDTNSLVPGIMVDRTEMLNDGASALYGTDAVGGVVNFITRDDFTGVELRADGRGTSGATNDPLDHNNFTIGALVGGSISDRLHIVAGFEYFKQEALEKFDLDLPFRVEGAFFAPYAEKSGLTIAITSPPDLTRLDSMVTSGRTDWDLAVLDGRSHWRAIDRGLLEPLDVGKIPNIDAIRPDFRMPYGVVTSTGASVIAWSRHGFADATPTRWADFWDLERFPGKRGMYHGLYWNYEVAMLALGVPSRDIYPVTDDKMDRALDHLARLKPHVAVWWRSGRNRPSFCLRAR